jgi:hypothetical protein
MIAPSGRQITIAAGDQRAVIVEAGGGLRTYAAGRQTLFEPWTLWSGANPAPRSPAHWASLAHLHRLNQARDFLTERR